MQNLPSGVKLVMSALSVMSDFKPDRIIDPAGTGQKILDYWGPAERMLGDLNFLKELIEIDKNNIQVICTVRSLENLSLWSQFDSSNTVLNHSYT